MPYYTRAPIIAIFLLLSCTPAFANEIENPNLLPFGEREAFMGNAGIAMEGSSGSTYYNPGALGFVTERKVSVYGNAYAFNRFNLSARVTPEQPDLLVKSSASSSVPLSSVTIFGTESSTYAFSLNTPHSSETEFMVPYRTPNIQLDLSQSASETSLWVGPSYARRLSPDFSLGASLFAARTSTSVHYLTYSRNLLDGSTTNTAQRTSATSWGALLILGAQWRMNHRWTTGLRIQSASLNIRGRTDYHLSSQSTAGSGSSFFISETGVHSRFRRPFQFGIGAQYSPRTTLGLFLDLNAQLPIHYNVTPSRAILNNRVETRFTPRANFGGKWHFSSTRQLMFGLHFNPSTVPEARATVGSEMREKYKGVTLGIQNEMGSLTSSIGGFYLWSSVTQGIQGQGAYATLKHQLFGLLLTASYKL